jgi:hypothetical protein
MSRTLLLILVTLLASGCTSSRTTLSTNTVVGDSESSNGLLPVTPRVLEQLPKGRYYRIKTVDPQISYVGRVVKADGDSVLLTDVDSEHRAAPKKIPLLGGIRVPSLPRLFKHSDVDVEILEGERTFARSQITAVELLTPVEVDHRLAVKQHAPVPDAPPANGQVASQRDKGWRPAG